MAGPVIDRRSLTLAGMAGLAALVLPGRVAAQGREPATPFAPEKVMVPTGPNRQTELSIWAPENPRAVALFSTGYNSWPERYEELIGRLNSLGIAIIAPLHLDSLRASTQGQIAPGEAFATRIADISAASGFAAEHFEDLPQLALGHSFGSLIAMCTGGALSGVGDFRLPRVQAVVAFSSPGQVEGLVAPNAYSTLAVPLLLITGTEDRVPGFVADPADHLLPVETSGADAFAAVVDGGQHDLVDQEAPLERLWPLVQLFLQAGVFDDATAKTLLPEWTAPEGDRFIVGGAK